MGTSHSQLFTSSGTFVPAAGVTSVFVTMVGGGGGGGPGHWSYVTGGGGGGAAESCMERPVKVTPGVSITVTIGGGGGGGAVNDLHGTNGGTTSFGSLVFCQGGYAGANPSAAGVSYALGGHGGGANGGTLWTGSTTFQSPAQQGTHESGTFYGGSSGGATNNIPGRGIGANSQANAGGQSYPDHSSTGWNGGGGAAPFGPGGDGGVTPIVNGGAQNGSNGGTGAGGGGAGGRFSGLGSDPPAVGGMGGGGACLVQWIA